MEKTQKLTYKDPEYRKHRWDDLSLDFIQAMEDRGNIKWVKHVIVFPKDMEKFSKKFYTVLSFLKEYGYSYDSANHTWYLTNPTEEYLKKKRSLGYISVEDGKVIYHNNDKKSSYSQKMAEYGLTIEDVAYKFEDKEWVLKS